MGTLADVFVRVLADDSRARQALRGFRGSLHSLGQQTATARVGADTRGADAQVKALRSRLANLEKTQITVPIKASRIDAEIALTQQRLRELTARTYEVDIEQQGDLNKEIKTLEGQLVRLERRKVAIPLTLERTAAEIAAVEAQLQGLERRRIRIPIIADLEAKSVQQVSGQVAKLLKFPALAAGAGIAAGSLTALTAGLFSVAAAAGPAFGALAAGGGSLLALGQGAGVAKFALSGLGDASKAVAAAQQAQAAGVSVTAAQLKKIAVTYGLTTDAGQKFVDQLLKSQTALDRVRDAAQEDLMPGLTRNLRDLTGLLPVFRTGVLQTTRVLGNLANQGTALVTSGPFRADFATVMSGNARVLGTFGGAGLSVLDIFRNLAVASLPLTQRFAGFVQQAALAAQRFVQIQRDGGGLIRFFDRAGDTAAQLGRIVGNIAGALYNLGRAGSASGRSLLTSFEGATRKLRELTSSVEGQNALREYFANAAVVTREASRLIADVGAALGRLGGNASLGPLIAQFRRQLLPAIERLLAAIGTDFGPRVIDLLTTLAGTFERLTAGGGALSSFVGTLDRMARALNAVLDSPIGPVVREVLKLAGAAAAVGLVAGSLMRVGAAFAIVGRAISPVVMGLARFVVNNNLAGRAVSLLGRGVTLLATGLRAAFAGAIRVALGAVSLLGRGVTLLATGLRVILAGALKAAMVGARALFILLRANPIGAVITVVTLLGMAFVAAYKRSETFRNVVQAVWRGVQAAARAAWERIRAVLQALGRFLGATGQVFDEFFRTVARVWGQVQRSTGEAVTAVRNVVSTALGRLRAMWSAGWAAVRTTLNNAWTAIQNRTTGALNAIRGFISGRLSAVRTTWGDTFSAIRNVAARAWGAIEGRVQAAMNKVRGIIGRAKGLIGNVWGGVVEAVKAPVRSLFGFINRTLIGNINGITSKFGIRAIPDLPAFAQGGLVRGPGGPTDDRVVARLSAGEFVVRAAAVKRPGVRRVLEKLNEGTGTDAIGGPVDFVKRRGRDIGRGARAVGRGAAAGARAVGRGAAAGARAVGRGAVRVVNFGADVFAKGFEIAARNILGPIRDRMRSALLGRGVIPDVGVEAMAGVVDRIIRLGRDQDQQVASVDPGNIAAGVIASLVGRELGRRAAPMRAGTYRVSSRYGPRGGRFHGGVDLAAPIGTPVYAPFAGVLRNADHGRTSYGKHVNIYSAGGLRFIGGHLSRFARGSGVVRAGSLVGFVGNTGRSTGPHLHAEVRRNGRHFNPRGFLRYDQGGIARGVGYLPKGTPKPERVLSPRQTIAFERLTQTLDRGPVTVNPEVYVDVHFDDHRLKDLVRFEVKTENKAVARAVMNGRR